MKWSVVMRDMQVIPISEYYDDRLSDERLDEETKQKLRRAQALMHEKFMMGASYIGEAYRKKEAEMELKRNQN
jgi:hypothetical protein